MMDTNVHVITPGPYRATKLWNEVTRLFRAGMPLKKHRQNFRHHSSCFTASAAVDWLHQLLCNNSNFGPDVTRQQTVQLLKKFLKNHVIEDVKCRWGTEDFEDNNVLYRFPSTSPLKRIPCPHPTSAPGSIKKRTSFRDKEGFFRFKTLKKQNKETQENVDPGLQSGGENQPVGEQQVERRELTVEDEREIWKDITLTHLQKILRVAALDDVLDQRTVNPQNIIHNMTKVNKHGVVSLDNKTNDLPHWLLSAMRSLANWPKYDTAQPSYPGFERDVFKSVSDYFYSLPQPLLTYELYELFINVLALSGYVPAPATHQRGKRKKADLPLAPPPAKASFRSTECLLLSLLRQGTCDETESPMREVLSGKLQSQTAAPKGGSADAFNGQLRGSCLSTCGSMRPPTRSFSLETILDDSSPLSRKHLFLSNDSLAPCAHSNSDITTLRGPTDFTSLSKATAFSSGGPAGGTTRTQLTVVSTAGLRVRQRSSSSRPRSYGSCLDIVVETKEEDVKESKGQGRSVSCLNVNTPAEQNGSTAASSSSRHPSSSSCHPFASSGSTVARAQGSQTTTGPIQPRPASSVSNLWKFPAPSVVRRCLSSLDVSKPSRPASLFRTPLCVPTTSSSFKPPQPKPEHSLVRPQTEGVAIEALQLCTLLLPPASRRKLQLLMRMMSRISQNVDMPRLHPAIATRTLMVHTFSGCVLGSAVEFDLDELLATRLVAFLMDHQESILSVPEYLLGAINDHIEYLRTAQVPVGGVSRGDGGDPDCTPMPIYTFCHQISGSEFENQKLTVTQNAMEELLEQLLRGGSMSEKDRRKKLKQGGKESAAMSAAGEVVIIYGARKEANMEATVCEVIKYISKYAQFQREYPDIYSRRFPTSEREKDKPKIKPALLSIKRTKAFGIRN